MGVSKEQVVKALADLESGLSDEQVSKASEKDLDQPEGADLGNPAKDKLSSKAPAPGKAAKPVAKSDDGDADDLEGDSDADEKGEKEGKEGKEAPMPPVAKKSFAESAPEEIQTKIDVSDFLRSLVDHTGAAIDGLKDQLAKSNAASEDAYAELAGAVEDIQKSQAKIGVVLKAVCERIGVIENAPAAAPKAETIAKSDAGKPVEREFQGMDSGAEQPMFKSLNENPVIAKSQISDAICELVRKGEATDMDVIGFESNSFIRPEVVGKLKTILN